MADRQRSDRSPDSTPGPHEDRGRPRDADCRPHDATLRFEYETTDRAHVVADAVRQEVGEIDGDRSSATVERDGETVVVGVVADDLVALRAGCNTWGSLVEVAERTTELA